MPTSSAPRNRKAFRGIIIVLLVAALSFIAWQWNKNSQDTNSNVNVRMPKEYNFPGVLPAERIQGKKVTLETNKGVIEFELYPDDAPKTVSNFVYLAEEGFYDGLTFHRVVPGFVIQGGDPKGTGVSGPGYQFEDEPVTKNYDQGIVAMANAGPDTNGSQFFIMLDDNPSLPKAYTIFGKVTQGMDVVKKIVVGDRMEKVEIH
ncbi:MAG: peptidylprolyl isomerase [Parcubacteria group bacterium]